LLELPEDVQLPNPRLTIARMAELTERHPKLNVMNLEAVAFALISGNSVALSPPAARGVLPAVLDAEHVRWKQVTLADWPHIEICAAGKRIASFIRLSGSCTPLAYKIRILEGSGLSKG